ncbi:MAG: tetratricopeptide repeat protein [Gallionella sp.]|nr:tetratricopeptide repeat protein [Gallionella sp.]
MNNVGRNAPCPCGSNRKYKHCCHHLPTVASAPTFQKQVGQMLQRALGLQQSGCLQEAMEIYHQVLRLAPDHPDALHLLGLIARQEGDYERAVELIGKATRLNPVAPLYFNLGNAYQSLGRLDEAGSSFGKAIELNSSYVAALNNLGIVFQQQGRLESAINCFRRALELQPSFAELYSNLGDVMRENRQFAVAIELIERSIALNSDFPNSHFHLGKAFHDIGEPERALACFHRALELNPDYSEAILGIAGTLYEQGKFDAARSQVERALQITPGCPSAWALLAFLKKMTPEESGWAKQASLLLAGKVKPKDAISLNYALGKYHDDIGNYAAAFPYYAHANCLQKEVGERFDRDHHRKWVDSVITANSVEIVRRYSDGSSDLERPVFIVGMPRSGTSLMEQILASHRDVFGAGELEFWNEAASARSLSGDASHHKQIMKLACDYEAELTKHSVDALRVIDKMPANFMNLGLIHSVFPKARIIHMQRTPVDTCLSIYFQSFLGTHAYANDLGDLAFYYQEYLRLMSHWRKTLPPEIFLDVPYEGLVEDVEFWSKKVICFLGLEWDDHCMSFHETERGVSTASNWQVRQKIYKTSTARWMNYREFIGPLLPLVAESSCQEQSG